MTSRSQSGLDRPRPVAVAVGRVLGKGFAAAARLRDGKPVHPKGMVYEAVLRITGGAHAPAGAPLLSRPARHACLVRFSRSAGFPPPLPDAFGLAVRILDAHGPGAHQDFLLVTSFDHPLGHHLLIPVTDALTRAYSSLLPYAAGDDQFIVGALPLPDSPRPRGRTADERLARAAATGTLGFAFALSAPRGRFRPIGTLEIGARRPQAHDAMAFDPYRTGGGIVPAGSLNAMRKAAYPLSQAARGVR